MPNNVINKVVYGDRTLIDLTDTTADAADVASGKYFYAKDGVKTLGTGSIGGENGDVYQDEEGYIVLKPGAGTNVSVAPLSVTENGTYSAPTGVAYSPVEVSVGPARSLSDITVSGSIVSGPAGLYSEAFSKAVNAGSGILTAGGGGLSTSLTINSSTGLITKTSSSATFTVEMQSGTFVSGYFSSYTDIRAAAVTFTTPSSTIQLPTLAATAYTPTETSQIIDRYQWLTGSQTIAAISSTYVGTGIDRRSAADMAVNGSYVTAPSGYYSQAFSKAVSAASVRVDGVQFYLNQGINFNSATGYISNNTSDSTYYIGLSSEYFSAGYINSYTDASSGRVRLIQQLSSKQLPVFAATTWTPGTSNQTISRYQWLTGSQTILGDNNLIASNIKSGVSIFGITGTVPDENDMPTVYQTWDDDLGGYTYSCNYTYNQILTMLTNLNGDPLAGELHDMNYDTHHGNWITYRYGGTWSIDDSYPSETYICLKTLYYKYIYHSNSLIESVNMDQDKEVIPSQNTQYINADYPHEYLNYVKVLGDNNLVSSNIRSGVSIFGVEGILEAAPIVPSTFSVAFYGTSSALSNWSVTYESSIRTSTFAAKVGDSIQIKYLGNEPSVRLAYGSYGANGGYIQASAFDLAIPLGPDDTTLMFDLSWVSIVGNGASVYDDIPFTREVDNSVFPSFSIPNRITHLGRYAFASVKSLYNVIGDNVWVIDNHAFYNTQNLSTASFPKALVIEGSAFQQCYSLSYISIPLVFRIGESAFYSCSKLTSLIAPKVNTIGNSAFYSCIRLLSISFPNATYINTSAFYNCSSLKSVNFPNCVSIGTGAFLGCLKLSIASFPVCEYIGSWAFASLASLSSVYLPSCITIRDSVFRSCTSLSTIDLPKCETIGAYAFANCTSLYDISCPNCTTIGSSAFMSCFNLESANFPNCTVIHYTAFSYCSALSSISFPACTAIGSFAFYRCSNLPSVYFPVCSNIGSSAFGFCSVLSIVSFPICKYIYSAAFHTCQALTSVYFPDCTSIGYSAFYNCTSLSIAIFSTSSGNTWSCNISSSAFWSCSALSKLYLLGSTMYGLLNTNAFNYTPISNSTYLGVFGSIYVPESLYTSYKASTNWVTYSSRFVSMTDAEIETFLSTLT